MIVYEILAQLGKVKHMVFGSLLPIMGETNILELFSGFSERERKYVIFKVLEMYLNQVMNRMSCGHTVIWAINQGILPMSTSANNSCYSTARSKLQEKSLIALFRAVGAKVEEQARVLDKFKKRNVKVVDGSSVQLLDTAKNRTEYTQPTEQKQGCGNPVMRLVAIMGLGTGVILDAGVGALSENERTLFRKLWGGLVASDILLGDRGFGSYAEVAMLKVRGVDVVFRQRQGCLKSKEVVKNNGKNDFLIRWKRPHDPGAWVPRDELPREMIVRAVRFRCAVRGGKTEEVILFTTLIDSHEYSANDLATLYRRRWEMELRLRDIKTVMGLELIPSKTPHGCRNYLWVGLTAYNLARAVMLDAAKVGRIPIARISFTNTLNAVSEFHDCRFSESDFEHRYRNLLSQLIRTRVPLRPGRSERRERKRRPKNGFKLMTKPRYPACSVIKVA